MNKKQREKKTITTLVELVNKCLPTSLFYLVYERGELKTKLVSKEILKKGSPNKYAQNE